VNIENFRQISPNQQTAFYDNAGNPQVWYANNQTGNPEYFNQMGNHPITQTPLKPVPIQLVARYKYVTENNEESETEGNNEEEKLASPKSDILNPTYTNTAINEVAILAFSKEEIDNGLEQVLNEKISEKNKNIAQLFYTTRFTSEQKKSVVMGDFSELPNLENYVDVVLVASSTYTFRKSKLNEQLIVCDVEVTYFQHNTKTKINGFSKSTTAVGSGFSKAEAKQNALNKLVI
jgi:hypothetical protein